MRMKAVMGTEKRQVDSAMLIITRSLVDEMG